MKTFGYDIEKLEHKKASLGMTDLELARLAGVTPSTVKNVLTGKTCKAPTIRKIAEALKIPLETIVVRRDEESAA